MPKVAIVGPTGYSGLELIEILLRHPQATITYLASRREEPVPISEVFPKLRTRCDLPLRPIDVDAMASCADAVFLCLPNGLAMDLAPKLLSAGLRVIDLSADYRLLDAREYERVYKKAHTDAPRLSDAHTVYGLPELFRERVASARLIANPGCYATCVAMAVAPLLRAGVVLPHEVIAFAASGISGAGREAKPEHHYPERAETFEAYNTGVHRHQPEIEQTLRLFSGCDGVKVLFCPHLVPMIRGIEATVVCSPHSADLTEGQVYGVLENAYGREPFVRLSKSLPSTRHVSGTNFVDMAVRVVQGRVVIHAALDNLVKGAAGQAVQNFNRMFDLPETLGLL